MLAHVTSDPVFGQGARRIRSYFVGADVWTRGGTRQAGLYDEPSGTLAMGVERRGRRWVLQTEHPTDAAGTWAISALGPKEIDALWGPRAAYRMWLTIRGRAGRSADARPAAGPGTLAGLDFNDSFPAKQMLISPEWTAGGLYAVRALLTHYEGKSGPASLTRAERAGLQHDEASMRRYLRAHPNAYAVGPGHQPPRSGATGFRWYSPPPDVHAMASVYFALFEAGAPDPLGAWRASR
jgi:hypothetical protein